MHDTTKRRKPRVNGNGKPVGRRPIGPQTLMMTTHLDPVMGEWIVRKAHLERRSQSSIIRQIVHEAMMREREVDSGSPAWDAERRMDLLAGGA